VHSFNFNHFLLDFIDGGNDGGNTGLIVTLMKGRGNGDLDLERLLCFLQTVPA
jgi:hypothetical protein